MAVIVLLPSVYTEIAVLHVSSAVYTEDAQNRRSDPNLHGTGPKTVYTEVPKIDDLGSDMRGD